MGTPNNFAQALRDTVIPMVSRLAPFQHRFRERLSELGIAYSGSPKGVANATLTIRSAAPKHRQRLLIKISNDAASATEKAAKRLCESFSDTVEVRSSRNAGI